MSTTYDKLYQQESLFGKPHKPLIEWFKMQKKGRVLDIGCGQGRNAIPLARMNFEVVGIDSSKEGVNQMLSKSKEYGLSISGLIMDMYQYRNLESFDYILLDSMFHLYKNDEEKEVSFINKVFNNAKQSACIIFCIPDTKKIVRTLKKLIIINKKKTIEELKFEYLFQSDNTVSRSDYLMLVAS